MGLLLALLPVQVLKAEIFKAGSYIINMGIVPQTYDNGLKPYGMVYDMVINLEVPLYWIIRPGKQLWETDFSYDGTDYKAGSLVLPAIYVTEEVVTSIAAWRAEGVVIDGPTTVDFEAPVYNYISSFPNAVLDDQNAKLTQGLFYDHTSIPTNYYTTGTPADITVCCDVYALPHADPQKWSDTDKATYLAYTDSKAQSFLWQGCHSVGAVEAHDPLLGMNILTTNGQISWDKDPDYKFDNDNTPDYLYELSSGDHPIMQIAQPLDDSSIASLLVELDFNIEEDVTLHVQDTFKISDDAQDINITTHVVIECKKFELGQNVTINIASGGSLTILAMEDSIFKKNSFVTTADGPEQFIFMGKKKLQLGDDGASESYDGFYYAAGELGIKKSTTINGATTSNDQVKLGQTDPTKDDASLVIYDAVAAADVNTSFVTNGFTGAALFPEAMYVISDTDNPNFTIDIGDKNDGNLDVVPVHIDEDMNYDKVTIPSDTTLDDKNQGSSALQDGSQKIYIPRPDSAWRSTTTVAIWDPDNVNIVLNKDIEPIGDNPNKAALVAFGRAFGDPLNGVLVQQTSHSATTGTEAQNVSSGRIYGNLLLQASIEKRPIVTIHAPNSLFYGNSYEMNATVARGAAPFDFEWEITCPANNGDGYDDPGTFTPSIQEDVSESSVIFTPNNNTLANCLLRVKVTDYCGRKNFATKVLGITGYHPSIGYYNVTHAGEDFGTSSGIDPQVILDPVNSLHTQISGKTFDVMLVALGSDKETLNTSKSGNVILELIDTAGVTEHKPSSCAEATVYDDLTQNITANGAIQLNNSATVTVSGISYPNAIREIGFRVSYYDLPLPTGDSYSYGIPSTMSETELDNQFPSCASSCSATRSDWGCYACIAKSAYMGGYGISVCARDNFAIRPEAFSLDLTGTSPFIGGRSYPFEINATKHGGGIDTWYTDAGGLLFAPTEDANITSILDTTGRSGCPSAASEVWDDSAIYFMSGQGFKKESNTFSTLFFSYDNVGDITIRAVENKWVAEADMDKSFGGGLYSDCIEGSSSNTPDNGKIGCMIKGEKSVTFIPSKFVNTLSLDNFRDGDFTYVADSEGTDPKYGANIPITFTAVLDNNTSAATNYTADCYAYDVTSKIKLTNDITIPSMGWEGTQGRLWMYDNNTTATPKLIGSSDTVPHEFTFTYPESHFNAGVATEEILFDFDRQNNTPDNPFTIDYSDFYITVQDDTFPSVIGNDFNRTAGNSNESDATFYYARAKSSEYFYDDVTSSSISTPISVVIYNNPATSSFALNLTQYMSTNEYDWYLSTGHSSGNNDGNITLEALSGGSVNPADPTVVNITNGINNAVTVSSSGGALPEVVNITFGPDTNSWVIYNEDNNTIPNPFYSVRFTESSGWTGHGKTGHVVGDDINKKKTRRLEW